MRAGPIITIGNLLGDRQAFATDLGTNARKPGKLTRLKSLSQVGRPPQVPAAERLLLAGINAVDRCGLAQSMLNKGRFGRTILPLLSKVIVPRHLG
jgi:hypothetical protein